MLLIFVIGIFIADFVLKYISKSISESVLEEIKPEFKKNPSVKIDEVSEFSLIPLLNQNEKLFYCSLVQSMAFLKDIYYVHTKVNLSEILKVEKEVFNIIESKRCDFLIVDIDFNPIMVIEYRGAGRSNRDKVKEIALDKAGIKYEVIHHKNDGNIDEYIKNEILPLLKN